MKDKSNFVVRAIIEIDVDGTGTSTVLDDLNTWLQNAPMYAGISNDGTSINSIFVGQLDIVYDEVE